MIKQTDIMMSKIGIRALVFFLELLMVVCLAVLQLKSVAELHQLELKVAAMKQKKEMTIGKSIDKSEPGRKIYIDATEYDEMDIDKLQAPKRQRRRRSMDELGSARTNSTLKRNDQNIYTPSGTGGALYTRWGRTSCPNDVDTELIYSGISGGSYYDHTGAAVNTLCLPNEPLWGTHSDGNENYAFIYGAEYWDQYLLNQQLYHNMPCAVCRSMTRTSTFMLPARIRCFGDWHLEYYGLLMSGHHTHKASTDYICVDFNIEAEPAGYRQENGRLLYVVEAVCGSLPCPKYVNGRELTCAVCSK